MNSKDRWTVIPAVYLVLEKDDKILLIRRYNTGYQDGSYSLPAGHINGGESAVMAMVREAKEEINIALDTTELKLVHTLHRLAEERDHERIDLYFRTSKWKGKVSNLEPHKCDELRWEKIENLPENMAPEVKLALDNIVLGRPYSDSGF